MITFKHYFLALFLLLSVNCSMQGGDNVSNYPKSHFYHTQNTHSSEEAKNATYN